MGVTGVTVHVGILEQVVWFRLDSVPVCSNEERRFRKMQGESRRASLSAECLWSASWGADAPLGFQGQTWHVANVLRGNGTADPFTWVGKGRQQRLASWELKTAIPVWACPHCVGKPKHSGRKKGEGRERGAVWAGKRMLNLCPPVVFRATRDRRENSGTRWKTVLDDERELNKRD